MSRPRFILWVLGLVCISFVSVEVWTSNLPMLATLVCQMLLAAEVFDSWLRLTDPGPSIRRARKVK